MLEHLSSARVGRSRRISSYDATGGNRDAWPTEADETVILAEASVNSTRTGEFTFGLVPGSP